MSAEATTESTTKPESGHRPARRQKSKLEKILGPLASLNLTVVLLALAVFMILAATLQQTRMDIWDVKRAHFGEFTENGFRPNLFVYMTFGDFVPPAWLPEGVDGSQIRLWMFRGLWLPSGLLVLVGLMLNLFAAHTARFKVQATGVRLVAGLGAIAFGLFVSAMTVWFNQNPGDFQGKMPLEGLQMWRWMQAGVGIIGVALIALGFMTDATRKIERRSLMACGFGVLALLLFLLIRGQSAFIGDAGMRILWQLFQGTIAASVLLVGCVLVFKRRGGIVLLHAGIGLLMLNEVFVTLTNVEQKMFIREGETQSVAIDSRSVEFAIYQPGAGEFEQGVRIPGRMFETGKLISSDLLPFDVQCVQYWNNAELVRPSSSSEVVATSGLGLEWVPKLVERNVGTDSDQRFDEPAAYVKLFNKKGKLLGTYLVSEQAYSGEVMDRITIDGSEYEFGLRYRRVPKPYSIKLEDVVRENYVGTSTPKHYGSTFELTDHERGISSQQSISMNNPLRYGNDTFYQSRFVQDMLGREYSEIQIVKNEGWMLPYLACMFVVIGMSGQLLLIMKRHLKTSSSTANDSAAADVAASLLASRSAVAGLGRVQLEPPQSGWRKVSTWVVAGILGLVAVMIAVAMLMPIVRKPKPGEFDFDALGRLPVTSRGRVLPLDSLARNTLRTLHAREAPRKKSRDDESVPAIEWLADTMFDREGWDEHHIIKVDDPKVQHALSLPKRKRFTYSLRELTARNEEFASLIRGIDKKQENKESITNFEKRLIEVNSKMGAVQLLRVVALDIPFTENPPAGLIELNIKRIEILNEYLRRRNDLPHLIPFGDKETGWSLVSLVRLRIWFDKLAESAKTESTEELASFLAFRSLEQQRAQLIQKEIVDRLVSVKRFREDRPDLSDEQFRKFIEEKLKELPAEEYEQLAAEVIPLVNLSLFEPQQLKSGQFAAALETLYSLTGFEEIDKAKRVAEQFVEMGTAYRNGETKIFNRLVAEYNNEVIENPPVGYVVRKQYFEWYMNQSSPFFVAQLLYILALVVAMISWLFLYPPLRHMAFWLIVIAVAVQTIGLVTRIYVSGRPPVTNIYSSAVFVGWAAVLSSLALELKSKFGLGNLLAAFGGMMTLFIAQSFATQGDTITVMQAVLDTQFWLATHVVIISLGYSGTFLAGFLGVIYILTGVLSPRMNKSTRKMLADQIHLVTCVSLLLSFFGTVLGGLWADDSWGRFWGWDPKENGALMIVLWNAVVLHARWGGVVRERGMAMLAIIGNIVVSWSWFAVNELGVGLHQYGATEGTMQNLFIFWGTQLAVCCIGALPFTYWWSYRAEEKLAAVRRGEAIPIAELSKQPARAPAQQAGRKKTPKRKKR